MKSKSLFLDKDHNFATKEEAKWEVIHTYNDDGELVEEVWVDLKAAK